MTIFNKINLKAKTESNTGFGVNATDYGGRFLNRDGRPNTEQANISFFERTSWFHTMLDFTWWQFLGLILFFFIVINFFFASLYFAIGVEHLGGMITTSKWEQYIEAFFFSTQTFTTVGYGRINPIGIMANILSAIEALTGLTSFALITGLLYGRFSKPNAYIRFSKNALIAPYKEGIALMLRLVPYKNTYLTDAEAKLTLGISMEENGKMVNRFYPLELEFAKVNALTLSWTIVHPITENSPLYKFTPDDYANVRGEVLVYIKAFDDMFSNTVASRSSYLFKEIVVGAKYQPMYHRNHAGNKTVLDFAKLNDFEEANVDEVFARNLAYN